MIHLQGRIRDYNATTDTLSIELDGIGQIETWLDNVAIDPAINRALIYHGNRCTLASPDPHRLDELTLVAINDKPSTPTIFNASLKQTIQTGRGVLATDVNGSGTTTVTFPVAYVSSPTDLRVTLDNGLTCTLSAISATTFTVTVTTLAAPYHSTFVYFTWQSLGH